MRKALDCNTMVISLGWRSRTPARRTRMRLMDICQTRSGWAIRPEWSACKVQPTDGYGCLWNIMLETGFPARKRKRWCWRLKSTADNIQSGAQNCCKSGSRLLSKAEKRLVSQRTTLAAAQSAKQDTVAQLQEATNPKRISVLERRCVRREKAVEVASKKLSKTHAWLNQHLEQEKALRKRLEQFEQENAENPQPLEACFRLDAGFGTYDNIALLIEMGYEIYVKLHNHKIVQLLTLALPLRYASGIIMAGSAREANVTNETAWVRVGNNAEMIAWTVLQLQHYPYPLDIALERFYTGQTHTVPASFWEKHSALAHFGATPVTSDLFAWFGKYNARQTIEAGIKETKQVFYLHRLKVRSEPAIYLQEAMTIFAANFIRWATVWIDQHAKQDENTLPLGKMGVKKQVQVAAHTSAKVIRNSDGMLLRFSPVSAFPDKQLFFPAPTRMLHQNYFSSFFTILALIAQKLR